MIIDVSSVNYNKPISRILNLPELLKKKSIFLFGPRQTGKSWLVRETLKGCRVYNLLNHQTFLDLNQSPQKIREQLQPTDRIVVIDEIQKLPELLDEVHLAIEENKVHFLLTGSSARKLRRGGVNLLGGRAWSKTLHPFVSHELAESFDFWRALNYGLLPSIYFSESPEEDLKAYIGEYLKEEIAAEALVRSVPAFSRFLEVAALCQGQMINYTHIANDAQVPKSTVQEYFQILRDTLVGYDLPAYQKTEKRKPITTSKFYFFDGGIVRALQKNEPMKQGSPNIGPAFENYLFHELKTYVDYKGVDALHYWRSTSQFEVDFILADKTAIEAKAKRNIGPSDLRGLKALMEEKQLKNYLVVCLEEKPRTVDKIHILPWKMFLDQLWNGEYI